MEISLEGAKPETLRAGLRTAIKSTAEHDVKLVQRADETYLVTQSPE
jgi:hypothetical protein